LRNYIGIELRTYLRNRQGWDIELVENSQCSFAFNVHRCFYLDVLTAYGAPELTALYCRLDDLLYATWSPSIRWERTKTLGRGDDCCDFRYSRGESGKATSGLIQIPLVVKRDAGMVGCLPGKSDEAVILSMKIAMSL